MPTLCIASMSNEEGVSLTILNSSFLLMIPSSNPLTNRMTLWTQCDEWPLSSVSTKCSATIWGSSNPLWSNISTEVSQLFCTYLHVLPRRCIPQRGIYFISTERDSRLYLKITFLHSPPIHDLSHLNMNLSKPSRDFPFLIRVLYTLFPITFSYRWWRVTDFSSPEGKLSSVNLHELVMGWSVLHKFRLTEVS